MIHAPRNPIMIWGLQKGTAVELIIQLDSEGKRRILSFRSMSEPPEVPL